MLATRKTPLLLLLAFSLLVGGCATSQTRHLGDGTARTFTYSDQGPEPAQDGWAEVTQATTGFAAATDAQFDVPFWWQFVLKVKIADLKALNIYDVTETPPRLLLTDPAPAPQAGEWRGRTSPEKFSRETAPWFFAPGASEHVFKIILANSRDEEHVLYQLCRHSEEAKKTQLAEIILMTAPEVKAKPGKVSTAPRQTPTEFNVFLPKKPKAPERMYSMSGNKDKQAVKVTIRPKGD